jgi:ribosome-binding factor A
MERINELLLREISKYVLENQPPDMGFVTFTAVQITEDLERAKVFYSVLGSEQEKANTAQALEHMKHGLAQRFRRLESLRRLPELHFEYDETPERAARLHEIIEHLHEPPPPPATPPRPRSPKKKS